MRTMVVPGKEERTHVVLPTNVAECDRVDILVEDERKRDGEVEDVETLGTEMERQNLDGIGNDQRSERKTRYTGSQYPVSD